MKMLKSCKSLSYYSSVCLRHRQHNLWLQSAGCSLSSPWQSRNPLLCQVQSASSQAGRALQLGGSYDAAASCKQHPRFYAPQLPITIGSSVELGEEEARHAVRVLRLKQGDHVELCDGRGGLTLCEMVQTDRTSASVVALSEARQVSWQGPKWILAAACLTLKGGRTDWLVEKATELGAYAVLPLITDRSQTGTTKPKFRSISSKASKGSSTTADAGDEVQSGRLQRLALAATKQSLRAHALQLLPAQRLQELLPALHQSPVSLVGTVGAPPALQVLRDAAEQQPQQVMPTAISWQGQFCYLLIGPEGDFTTAEVEAMAEAGVLPVGLGSNRLRTETAALALLTAAVLTADASVAGVPADAAMDNMQTATIMH